MRTIHRIYEEGFQDLHIFRCSFRSWKYGSREKLFGLRGGWKRDHILFVCLWMKWIILNEIVIIELISEKIENIVICGSTIFVCILQFMDEIGISIPRKVIEKTHIEQIFPYIIYHRRIRYTLCNNELLF